MIFVASNWLRLYSATTKLVSREMSSVRVKVCQGVVRGCEDKLPDGRKFLRFSGIPYAEPPIGKLRFQSPKKLTKFDVDEIDCTEERDACFHKSTLTKKYVGSEDCLNVNVYVPENAGGSEKFAVMVFIHGGGFKYDSNSRQYYSPEYLLMENVIVVTVNYRQHALGFMYWPRMGISGNAGLKDQQMALQWVHENIENFNGDPENICLFGESGGGACAHLQVMNEKSRRYISKAICQSGTSSCDWGYYNQNEETVKSLARIVGCQSDDDQEIYKHLMEVDVKKLYDNCDKVITAEENRLGIRNKWRIVIEEDSENAFTSQRAIPSIVSQAGEIKFPMMFGTTTGDGMPVVASIFSRKKVDLINENFHLLIPRSIQPFIRDEEDAKNLAKEMRKLYLNGEQVSQSNIKDLVIMRTDIDYLYPQTITNDLNVRYNPDCKQFLYEFRFDGKLNLQKKQMGLAHLPIAGHADDVFHLFGGTLSDEIKLDANSREAKMRKLMCKLWTNFAKYGDPTPDHDNPLPFKWTPVEPASSQNSKKVNLDYLVLDDEQKMERNLNETRMNFWRNVYRKWFGDFIKAKL